jgi:hypothetical protein
LCVDILRSVSRLNGCGFKKAGHHVPKHAHMNAYRVWPVASRFLNEVQ